MPGPGAAGRIVRFAAFELDIKTGELRKHGLRIKLQGQPIRVLAMLIEHAGEAVTREDLQKRLWPADTYVDFEHSLNAAIKRLRAALGDSADAPRFVETLPRQGYRFVAPVSKSEVIDPAAQLIENPLASDILQPEATTTEAPPLHASGRRALWPWTIVASALVLVAAILGSGQWGSRMPENPLDGATITRLTDYEGAKDAAISPNGEFVAYLSDQGGNFAVWRILVGSGTPPINLTPGPENQNAPLRGIGFSRDGLEIWLAGTPTKRVRMLPLMGGEPRVFLGENAVNPVWSPDGTRLAYHTSDPGDPIFVADRDGAHARQVFRDRADRHNHYLAWGADGDWIYFVHGTPAKKETDLWRIRASGGDPERLTQQNSEMRDPTPLGRGAMLYLASESDGSGPWIWGLDIAHKTTRRITIGVEQYTSLSASADGRLLAATVANPNVGLWTVPILDTVAGEPDVKPFELPAKRTLTPRFRGNALYYLSAQGAGDGLWRFQDGKTYEIWRGTQGGLQDPPAVSPDGRRIAIVIRERGKRRLRLITADGAESNAFAPEIDVDGSADWSPTGEWIVTGGDDGNGEGLFKIPTAGGRPVRLTSGVGRNPVWSPDGSLIAYSGENVFTSANLLAVRPDGTPVKLPEIKTRREGERQRFLPNGQLVYMQGDKHGADPNPWQDFWLLDIKSMKTRRLTQFNNHALMRTFDITRDGKIVFDRQPEKAAVVLIDLRKRL